VTVEAAHDARSNSKRSAAGQSRDTAARSQFTLMLSSP
jgi:diacylglycerol kinase